MSDYYVSQKGRDDFAGTIDRPWKTIQFAIGQVKPSDIIYIRSGVYSESISFGQISGVKDGPITLAAYEKETVVINGSEGPALINKNDAAWWIIEGITLGSQAELTIDLGEWNNHATTYWTLRNNRIFGTLSLFGSYNTVEGNEIGGSGAGTGIREWTDACHHNRYLNNVIHGCSERAIWSMFFTHDSLFEGNHIYDCAAQGIDLDGYTTCVYRHVVRGNHIHDVGQNGVALENAYATTVENNTIHDSAKWGIAVINYGGDVGEVGHEFECRSDPSNSYGDTDGDNDCRGNLTGNIIRKNLIYNMNYIGGICIWYAGGVSVLGNTIAHVRNGAGINVTDRCPGVIFRDNAISDCDWGPIKALEDVTMEPDSLPRGISRVAAWKSRLGTTVLLDIGGRSLQLTREELDTYSTGGQISAALLDKAVLADVSLPDDVSLHINRDGSIAVATGLEPQIWPEDTRG